MRTIATICLVCLLLIGGASQAWAILTPYLIHEFTLDSDPGWTYAADWAFGQPTGAGSHCGDPSSAYTGTNVYGNNLEGDYDRWQMARSLTTTAIDCSGLSEVELRFWRWLGVSRYDRVHIRVSNDFVNWYDVWTNPTDSDICDTDWVQSSYLITAAAADEPIVYIMWVMGPTEDNYYPGWNIDDIQIYGSFAAPFTKFYDFSFDTDPGWSVEGDWQFGEPLGGSGMCNDPEGGNTGPNVYGSNLAGPYTYWENPRNLTSTAIDCSEVAKTKLRFWRWLGVSEYAGAAIKVSNDGETWKTIWGNSASAVCDTYWREVEYDISSVADGESTVYLRWVMGPTQDNPYAGWNVDDVQIWGIPFFGDVPADHWAFGEIMTCVAAGVVAGYADNTYQPSSAVTRDQMAVYIARAAGWVSVGDDMTTAPELFPDVPAGFWAGTAIQACVGNTVVAGYEDGNYRPYGVVTRDQMAVYIARAAGWVAIDDDMTTAPELFPDVPAGFWAGTAVEACVDNGVVQGYGDGLYRPSHYVTRDQMAVYIARAYGLLP
jgi:hypothetical protein